MKRILINATHNEEIRVALCKDNHLYDFDLENRTREQKKSNIYKGHVTRVEPSLEAVFVEYGSERQGFLPLREIAPEYLNGNPREDAIKKLIKEGDELIVQVEKEERGNKGAALSTYISLAGRYLVLMPNNAKGGGISRQISGKVRDEMKQIINSLALPKGMSVIVRTAGIGKTYEDLQNDLNHLLDIWANIQKQNRERTSPCLVHQEAGVVTRAVRDYLRDDIGEVWIDSEHAYNEAASFIASVMPSQMSKLRKYTDYEPMFSAFGIERQIESAYQREVRLPSGGSIVIDQTEALVSIDINSSKSTKGSDVAETAFHTNLEAADEIARQLRLRDMGGLIVIDFIDMSEPNHQKEVEKRLIEATRYDRARVQFAEISKFGLMEMSRQRLRPSLEESTGYICPRCHGNGMIRDLRSLALSIMRQIEQIALKQRSGEVQAEVPTEIAAFLLNEKRESLVYLEQDSGTRITVLPHAHLESPNFSLHFNPDGFAPASYERIVDVEEQLNIDRGYDVNWQTTQTPTQKTGANHWQQSQSTQKQHKKDEHTPNESHTQPTPHAVAWLSNLFAPKAQAKVAGSLNNQDAAAAIEAIVNTGAQSLGAMGMASLGDTTKKTQKDTPKEKTSDKRFDKPQDKTADKPAEKVSKPKADKPKVDNKRTKTDAIADEKISYPKREAGSRREARAEVVRSDALTPIKPVKPEQKPLAEKASDKEAIKPSEKLVHDKPADKPSKPKSKAEKVDKKGDAHEDIVLQIQPLMGKPALPDTLHLSLDNSKDKAISAPSTAKPALSEIAPTVSQDAPQVDDLQASPQTTKQSPTQEDEVSVSKEIVKQDVAPVATAPLINEALLTQIAKERNLAKNDPRVVMQALAQTQKPVAITGTAGAFIRHILDDAETALAQEGFVACFIRALDSVHSQNQPLAFDFVNYGYAPLSAQAIAHFDDGIRASAQFDTSQGKTIAPERPLLPRAKNDPRGQHPSLTKTAAAIEPDVAADKPSADTQKDSAAPLLDDATPQEQNQLTTQETSSTIQDAVHLAEQVIDSVAHLAENISDNLSHLVEEMLFGDTSSATTNTPDSTSVDDSKKARADKEGDADTSGETSVASEQKKPAKKADKKSKSYKNMIENVAEQLLPQTGILTLATPKPAKVRIKKPKAQGSNKPKAEVVKKTKASANANDVSSDTPIDGSSDSDA